jgi:hypothetical protein
VTRQVRQHGQIRLHNFGLYVDRVLWGQTVAVLIYDEALRIEHAEHLLVSYPCIYETTRRQIIVVAEHGRQPYRSCPMIQLLLWAGIEPLHFLDMKVIEGALIEQRTAILEFIQRHISMSAEVKGLAREERWEYPLEALREAVANALCHREYRDPGNVQVRIFDDRFIAILEYVSGKFVITYIRKPPVKL